MARPKILIVKTGTAASVITQSHGDYDRWFIEALGDADRFRVVDVFRGEPLPHGNAFDGAIVTGSPLSVCTPEPWMESTANTLLSWCEAGQAVLGVCFGHQLLSWALGTPIIRNPKGREIGTVTVELTEAGRQDALFMGLPPTFSIQTTHTDVPENVPVGATLLATNAHSPVQALTFGRRARGVQFHPELTAPTMRTLLDSRRELLAREGLDPEALTKGVVETTVGAEILRRFEERLVGG